MIFIQVVVYCRLTGLMRWRRTTWLMLRLNLSVQILLRFVVCILIVA